MRRAACTLALAALLLAAVPFGAGAHPNHGATEIGISQSAFTPAQLRIVSGDVVFWTWNGPDLNHTVTGSGPGKAFESDPGVSPEQVSHRAGDRFADAFSTPGTYTYLCRVHPDRMRGTIVVAPVDRTAPALRRVSLAPARMCRRCRRPGGRVRFTLSERADVEVTIYRVRRGRLAFAARRWISGRTGRNAPRFRVAACDRAPTRRASGRATTRTTPRGRCAGVSSSCSARTARAASRGGRRSTGPAL